MTDNPAYKDKIATDEEPRLAIMADITGGLSTMRKTVYLTKFEGETDEAYKKRMKQTEYNNTVNETIELADGKIFRKPLAYEDIDPQFGEWAEDVTGSQTTLNEWAKNETKTGIRDGLVYAFIDYPAIDTTGMTDAQITAVNAKPTLSRVKFSDIQNRRVNDQGELIQATIKETITRPKGIFEDESITQYRVLYIDGNEVYQDIYEQRETGKEPQLVSEAIKITPAAGSKKLVKLPLIPLYTNKIGDHNAIPPLLEQANLTISWFNVNSQYGRALEKTGDPTLAIEGRQPDENGTMKPIKIGANSVLDYSGPVSPQWLELKGQSLNEFRERLDRIQTSLDKFKSSIQEKNNAPVTAKQISVEASDKVSQLTNWAWGIDDYLAGIMEVVSAYMGIDPKGKITTNKDFEEYRIDEAQVRVISDMEMKGQVSQDTMWDLMIKGEWLPSNFDKDEEARKIQEQPPV